MHVVRVTCIRMRSCLSVISMVFAKAFCAPERHDHHPRHVNGCEKGCKGADKPQCFAPGWAGKAELARAPNLPKNLILPKKTGKDGNAENRQPTSQHRRKGNGHVFLETTHTTHVLLVMHAVNDRSGTEKEQSFEKRMRDHMKECSDESTHPASQKHVAKLRNRGVSKHLLNIVLRDPDCRSKDRSCRADDCDNKHRGRGMCINGRTPHDHINTGSDHGCGVDERGNWCG